MRTESDDDAEIIKFGQEGTDIKYQTAKEGSLDLNRGSMEISVAPQSKDVTSPKIPSMSKRNSKLGIIDNPVACIMNDVSHFI